MINAVKEYFLSCPAIQRRAKVFGINNLAVDPLAYTVEDVPGNPIRKHYVDGSAVRERSFVLASRETYSKDAIAQNRNSATYDAVCAWVEQQNALENYPDIPEGDPLSVEVSSSAYVLQTDGKTARYQIQIKVIYFTEAITK